MTTQRKSVNRFDCACMCFLFFYNSKWCVVYHFIFISKPNARWLRMKSRTEKKQDISMTNNVISPLCSCWVCNTVWCIRNVCFHNQFSARHSFISNMRNVNQGKRTHFSSPCFSSLIFLFFFRSSDTILSLAVFRFFTMPWQMVLSFFLFSSVM